MASVTALVLVSLTCLLGFATPALAAGGFVLSLYGGTGSAGAPVAGPVAASPIAHPQAMAADAAGNVWTFVTATCRVVKVTPGGVLSVVAGNGTCGTYVVGSALSSPLSSSVKSLAVDSGGNLFIGDNSANRIFKVTSAGQLSVFAGTGSSTAAPAAGPATSSAVMADSMAIDAADSLYVGWAAKAYVLKITSAGTLSVFAGNGTPGAVSNALSAPNSRIGQPASLAVDSGGAVYIGDVTNKRVYKVALGVITTTAGTGATGAPVPGSTSSPVPSPTAMAVDSADTVYVVEGASHEVLSFTTLGGSAPTLVAGTGGTGAPSAGAATSSPLGTSTALVAPSAAALLIGDYDNNYLLRVAAPTAPGAPTGLTATPGPGTATLTFTPPASNGGSAITGYEVTTNGLTWSSLTVTGTSTKTGTVTGLANGTSYPVQVRAVNAVGTSAASATASVTPATTPGAPTLVVPTSADSTINLTYLGPLANGGSAVTGYEYSIDGGAHWVTLPAGNAIGGLVNGTTYTVLLRAVNAVGGGTAAAGVTATPRGAPTAPTGLSAVPGNGQFTLTFTTPGDGGYAILGYQVSTDDGATWAAATVTTAGTTNTTTVTGLANGATYPVRVRALNLGGNGTPSAATPVVLPALVPDAPTGLTAVAGSTTIALSFQPPASTGGRAITGYEVSTDNGVTWAPITVADGLLAKTATVTGLTNGTAYTVRLRAGNVVGAGPASASVSATPTGVPYAPTGLTAVTGNGQATLTFTTPGNGGNPILGYQVSTDDGATWGGLTVTTSGTTNTGTVTGLTNGTTYPVRVRAVSLAGGGLSSAAVPVTPPVLPPDAPTGLGALAGDASIALSFQAPAGTLTGYEVSTDNGVTWGPLTVANGLLSKTATVSGLVNGTAYVVRVRADNVAGAGAASAGVSATPRGAPYAPTGLSAVPGNEQATVTFTTPADGGNALLGYQVSTDGGTTWAGLTVTTSGTTNTGTVTGLTNGTTYPVRVRAYSLGGTGAASAAAPVTLPQLVPAAPTGLMAVAGDASIALSFQAPASNGGSAITGYEVTTNNGVTWAPITVTDGLLSKTATVGGLVNGATYAVAVRAVNAVGSSAATAAVSATPRGAPYAPTGLTAVPGNGQATLTFTTPGDGGNTILGYQVSTDGGTTWNALTVATSGSANTGTVTGLTNGTTYQVQVRALNLAGSGTPSLSVPVVLPILAPGAPTGLTAVAGDASIAVSFQAPSGSVTGYEVSTDNGVTWSALTVANGLLSKTATVSGLINGTTYAVAVRAVNSAGAGPATASVSATPRGAPYAPTGLSAVPGNAQATLTFTTPGDGGNTILGYQVSTDDGGTWSGLTVTTSGTSNTGTVTGLTNGTTYPVRVRAYSLGGTGASSARATVALPLLVPDAPTGLLAVAGSTTIALSFQAPAGTGGTTITGYEVSTDNGVTWAPIAVTNGLLAKTATITGLTNGTTYAVRLRADNSVGPGPAGAAVSATPTGVPYAPSGLSAVPGDGQATLTFTTPADGGNTILGYQVSTDDGATWGGLTVTTSGTANTGTVTGLSNGNTYAIRVRALNLAGAGLPSAGTAVTLAALAPDAPTFLVAVAGDARITLMYQAPGDNGGRAITGYEVTTDDGATWAPLAADNVVTGLVNGTTYTVRVRADNAVGPGAASTSVAATPRGAPNAPVDLTAVPGNGQAVLSFTTPGTGGYPILGYQVSTDDGGTWSALTVSTSGTANTGTVTGLTNGTAYAVRVRATSLAGSGIPSAAVAVTPATVPGAPTSVAAAAGNTEATVTFTPPASNGGTAVTGYQVSTDNGVTWVALPANGLVGGLVNGTTYAVRVRAVNAIGAGAASTPAPVTPVPDTPDPPTGLTAARGDSSATLTFTAPASPGASAITGYQVSLDNGMTWNPLPADHIVTGLTNGTAYAIRVRAVNASGPGPASASAPVTPAAAPGAPTALSVAAGDSQAVLTYTAPGDTGGDPITAYEVSTDDGATWAGLPGGNTVTGLTNGTLYRFRVRAVNGVGPGTASASVSATPAAVPDAPTGLSVTPGDSRAVVSFTAPTDDGGASITGYQVSTDDGTTWAALPGDNTVTGLTNGTTYVVRVRALNRVGSGPASDPAPVTPDDGLPGVPTGLTVARGDASVTLAFTAPANIGSGPITGYEVSTDGGAGWSALASNRTVTGLTNGTGYRIQVRAVNATGSGPATAVVTVTPATIPDAPGSLTASPGDRSITVTAGPPADDGGDPIVGYQVSTDDGVTWAALPAGGRVAGLTNGTTYAVRVRAVNGVGPGSASASVAATPSTVPGAPTGLSAQRGDGTATLTFTAPTDTGGNPIAGYQVSADDGSTWAPLAANRVVTGLTNGVTYTVRVRATTSSGPGPASAPALVTPATTPDAPGGLTASAGDAQAVLMFTAPGDGGDRITGYEVSTDDGGTWSALAVTGSGSARTGTVTGLVNDTTYTLRVRAANGVGTGPASAGAQATPVGGLPGAPTGLTATRGDASATLAFTAPADTGSGPITGYDVSVDGGAHWVALAANRVVTGLTNGTAYNLWVRARNATGPGPAGGSATVTPATNPGAPAGLTATPGHGSASLSFTAPADDGGDPVTGYQVSTDDGATWSALATDRIVTGLTDGTTYTVRVRAVNSVGVGAASASVPVTPAPGTPGAPTDVIATRGDARATLTFTPPADPGSSPVSGYEVSADNGATWSPLAADGSVTGLTNGAVYTFRVRARNAAGPGPAGNAATVMPAAPASAPTGLTATAADSSARLAFTYPGDDGGSAITGYQVSTDDGTTWGALTVTGTTGLTATVTGLSNGTSYLIRVRAVTAVGGGTASDSATVTPVTTPGQPTALNAAAGDSQIVVMFAAPATDGGSAITGYQVSVDNGTTWVALAPDRTVTGLSNGTSYTVRVRAVNGAGTGPASDSVTVAPVSGLPGAPTGLTATRGDSSATLTFTAPANTGSGAITGYEVSTDDGWNWALLAGNRTVTALTNGTTYPVRVRAVNATGSGPASAAATVTPAAVPGPPTGLRAAAGDGSVSLTFTPPAGDGGDPIVGYQVSTDDGTTWAALPADGTVTGLANGTTYAVRVRAVNGVGAGPASVSVRVTPAGVAGAPTGVIAVAGDGSATITFTAPADNGGSTITGYEVSTDNGGTWVTLPANGTVTGLTNGTAYPIRVRARTDAGAGTPSAATTVTPAAVPGAPAGLTVTPGNARLTLAFTAPASSGGSPITGYQVSTDDGTTWAALPADRVVTGLTNGNTYTVRVRAVNGVGAGPASAGVPGTPVTVPGAPTGLTATPGDASVSVSFTPPGTGGTPITSYEASSDDGTTWSPLTVAGATTKTGTLIGLSNGTTYAIRIRARNSAGAGAASANATATPVNGLPGSPTAVAVTSGDASATVTFTAGAGTVTGYQVSLDDGVTWAALPADGVLTGLTNGVTYAVRLRAVNSTGTSPASASVVVTPATTARAPTGVTAVRGDRSATVTFTPPSSDGGSAILGYQMSTDDGTTWQTLDAGGRVTGLTNGTTYVIRVRARTSAGAGAASASVPVTPAATPGAPAAVAAARGDRSATVTFTPPASDGGSAITGYEVTVDGVTWTALAANGVVPGLTNGTTYPIQVRARNDVGAGTASAPVPVTPATTPGTPTAVVATRGDRSATVTFTPPASDGGSAITGYEVSTDNGTTWTALAANGVVTGLTNGTTYGLQVRARTSVGAGAASASVPVTPAAVPGVPTGVTVTRGDSSATVAFTPPANPGGSAITGYEVSADDGVTWSALAANGVVGGLTNGTTYAIRVRARNGAGAGPQSSLVTVTPATTPGTPTAVSAAPGDASVTVTYTPPADGGSAITGYEVSTDDGATWQTLATDGLVTGLTNGTAYAIRLRARNNVGTGPASTGVTVTPVSGLPGAPGNVTITRGNASLSVTYTAGTGTVTGYQVSLDNGVTWAALPANGTVTGLTNGTAYTVRLRALSSAGAGPASAGQVVTPATTPAAPATLTATARDSGAALTITAGGSGGSAVTAYEVSLDNGTTWATLAADRIVTGLTNGVAYTVSVRARNDVGAGPATTTAVTPAATPGAPTAVTATAGDRSATVTYTAGSTGGSAITGYQVSIDDGTTWQALPATGVVGGLTNGTAYAIRVRALNSAGSGAASARTTVTPATTPGVPTAVTASAGDASVTLAFTSPTSDGGSAITGYQVSTDDGVTWQALAANRVVGGLTNGNAYAIRVRALNSAGPGTASARTTATPTAGLPGAPTGLTVVRGDSSITVTFTPGGGDPVVYQVSTDGGVTWAALAANGVVAGLTNGTTYVVSVRAVNTAGPGPATAGITVTPATVPTEPAVSAIVITGTTATVTFVAPDDDGGAAITGYDVSVDDGATWNPLAYTGAGPFTGTVTGLTTGTTYVIVVRAVNAAGAGPASEDYALDPAPSAPTGVAVTRGDTTATVTYTPLDDDSITGYQVSLDNGVTWADLADTGIVTGLDNSATYTVLVRAVNNSGAGRASAAVTSAPGGPGAAQDITATGGTSSILVSWSPPDSSAVPVTGYRAVADPGPATCSVGPDATSCRLGATAGVTYTLRVVSLAAGGSTTSTDSATATPDAPIVPATPPATSLTLTTSEGAISTVTPGQQIVLVGTGFAPYSSVTIVAYSTPVVLAEVVTDGDGAFSYAVRIPAGLAAGTHTLLATGVDPDGNVLSRKLTVTVRAGSSTPTPKPTPGPAYAGPGSIPKTGQDIPLIAGAGLLMIGAGAAMLLVRRQPARRR